MNIGEALTQISRLTHEIEWSQAAIDALQQEGESCRISYDSYFLMAPRDELIKWAQETIEKSQKELDKLQDVVDMANAALKEVLSND